MDSYEDISYIKGFEDGCDYIVAEIERWIKQRDYEPRIIGPVLSVLAHLKMEKQHGEEIRENT
jgi:hypothetical protein